MKTSLNSTQDIDAYLSGSKSPEENLLFEAQLLLDEDLLETMTWQKQVYALIQSHGRKRLKAEIGCPSAAFQLRQARALQPENKGLVREALEHPFILIKF